MKKKSALVSIETQKYHHFGHPLGLLSKSLTVQGFPQTRAKKNNFKLNSPEIGFQPIKHVPPASTCYSGILK